ncbi:MAG: flagellar export protein FliJ [Planctomycetes bacterium]|nr:flagellar export protein FliJ [Planctomycetota bacterium]
MARRFRFNLEAVLRYRQIMEDQKRRDFAEANRLLEEEKVRRQEILQERSEMQDEIVKSFEERAPFQSVVQTYHMVGRLEMAAQESLGRQHRFEPEKERRRLLLVSARQETRMMETLKDRRREEFNREQDRLEQSLLDELSIQAAGRRIREQKDAAGETE